MKACVANLTKLSLLQLIDYAAISRTLGVRLDCSKIRITDLCHLRPVVLPVHLSLLVRLSLVDIVNPVDPPQSIDVDVYLDCMSSLN